jgi:peptide/nickel transport system ATP-binding protein
VAETGTASQDADDILLKVEDLVVEFPTDDGRVVHAVSGIGFDVTRGETLGLVGESGSGKSTTGRAIMQLPPPTGGTVRFAGAELTALRGEELRRMRPRLQMVFQDPISSLNPRRRVRDIVAEPLRVWAGDGDKAPNGSTDRRVADVLDAVGLDVAKVGDRRPREFSGGQCQRISIARSLVLDPDLLICDEPVSALDVSVQAQILNLLKDAKERYGLTMIFIAHDLGVVKNISDRVAVMYLGKLCEVGSAEAVYARSAHPYTAALLEAIPVPDPRVRPEAGQARGEVPSPIDPPSGCRFRTRCPRATDLCAEQEPTLLPVGPGHDVACHFPLQPLQSPETPPAADGAVADSPSD